MRGVRCRGGAIIRPSMEEDTIYFELSGVKFKMSLKKKGSQGIKRRKRVPRPRETVWRREQKPETYAPISTCKFLGGAGPTVYRFIKC